MSRYLYEHDDELKCINEKGEMVDFDITYLRNMMNEFYNVSKKRKHRIEEVPILKLMNYIYELMESYLVLEDKKMYMSANIITRSIFEHYLSLKFILLEEELIHRRLCDYIYFDAVEDKKFFSSLIDSPENSNRQVLMENLKNDLFASFDVISATKEEYDHLFKSFDELSDLKCFCETKTEYARYKKLNKNKIKNFYSMTSNANNIYELACMLNMGYFYKCHYKRLSRLIHGNSAIASPDETENDMLNLNYPSKSNYDEYNSSFLYLMFFEIHNLTLMYFE